MSSSYIHIPFCDLKCKYCRFASVGISQKLKIDFYVKNLISEIKKSPFKKEILNSIYFGGGTPSVLSKEHLEEILDTLRNKFGFSKNIEITLESTPNNITKENLEIWKKLGINRLSIGIQTLNKQSLKEINRGNKGDIDLCFKNLTHLASLKIGRNLNISLDFIIGLPYVKKGEILENIKYVLEKYSFIKHISVYMLEEYYNPDKIVETKYDNITYPKDWDKLGLKDEDYLEEYSSIKNYLIKLGFKNYEISNFAKPGSICKHNKGYWEHREVFAFGIGAGGLIKEPPNPLIRGKNNNQFIRYLNADNFRDYYDGKKIFEEKLTKQDIFLEKLMFGLRTSGISKDIYSKLNQEKLNYFIENGYLEKSPIIPFIKGDENIIRLTDKGILVMDYILGEIV